MTVLRASHSRAREARTDDEAHVRDRTVFAADLARVFDRILPLLAGLIAVSWLLVAAAHVGDRAFLLWREGSRMALAHFAREGTLYPPLFAQGLYGGTRLMPLPILAHAGLSVWTGELLSSGKLFTYLSFTALVGAAWAAMRSVGCSPGRSAALIAGLVATNVGVQTSLGISHDGLPVALQLVALILVTRSARRRTVLIAAVLCSIAFLSKLSALWGFAAIALWLWRRDRALLRPLLGASVASAAIGLGLVQIASDGRFAENLVALSGSGVDGSGAIAHILEQFVLVFPYAPVAFILLPVAGVGTVSAIRVHRMTIYHLALMCSFAILLLVLMDQGSSYNHFLDATTLAAIVTADLWGRWKRIPARTLTLALLTVLGLLTSLPFGLGKPAWETLEQTVTGTTDADFGVTPLDGLMQADQVVLSEDPAIPLLLGQDPIVLDAFMLLRIGERHPEWVEQLVGRIERGEFDRVVLEFRLDDAPEGWYTESHFGPRVIQAIRNHYVLLGVRAGFAVYAPREIR